MLQKHVFRFEIREPSIEHPVSLFLPLHTKHSDRYAFSFQSNLTNRFHAISFFQICKLLYIGGNKKNLIIEHMQEIIAHIKNNPENYREGHNLGSLGGLDSDFADAVLPIIKDNLTQTNRWNSIRFAIFNLEVIGKKYPEKIRDMIPIVVDYVRNPKKIENELKKNAQDNSKSNIEMAVAAGINVDPKTWIRDAGIDFIGGVGKKHPELVKEYESLLEDISKNAKSQYSRKKAKRALENLK